MSIRVSLIACLGLMVASQAVEIADLVPNERDQGQIWWADGFPSHREGARWLRVIKTGYYSFALNTETLEIPAFGAPGDSAELELKISVNGKEYFATGGAKWTQTTGPRLVESGYFFQRMDVTDLKFQSQDGESLRTKARFEVAAWPDRLGMILSVELGDGKIETSIRLKTSKGVLEGDGFLALDPVTGNKVSEKSPVVVTVNCPVDYEPSLGWHRININRVASIGKGNDVIERIHFLISNPSDREEVARLMFEKVGGFRGRLGSPITGVSAILCDTNGQPTGIPVQLSKNWHRKPEEKHTYDGQWFHGITQLRLAPGAKVNLQLVIANAHWGGVAAASHAQLCLIGWGGNSLWEQSALGCWGESICYDPDQALANTTITDVRPLMVSGKGTGKEWAWTNNMGGGDFFRLYDLKGDRVAHSEMKTSYHKYGPCLTEVSYEGKIGEAMKHRMTMSLGRTDDVVRGTYRVRLEVEKAVDFSRFIFFQVGSDTYNFTKERKMAFGNQAGLVKEWDTQWGGNTYRGERMKLEGDFPWVSLHEAVKPDSDLKGAVSNRGVVVRLWKARIGGEETAPWIAEHGLTRHGEDSSTIDFVPPPGRTRFEPGDYIEATFEHIMMPQFAKDYYGPNAELRAALGQHENSWRMIHRESEGNARKIEMRQGALERRFPDVRISVENVAAKFSLEGGLGYVPITLTGLKSHDGIELRVDGELLDQSVHGNDFWQCNYDPGTKSWSQTFNVPFPKQKRYAIEISPQK
ncbi:hypothetical protein N9230_01095 [Akkermansiaceae bacterium]|nr:hypothetical protein [Akkermansiaceae bacterium]